jgi:hypothetical protein
MKVMFDGILYVPAPPAAEGMGLDAALDVRFDSDAGDQLTIREYFRELLTTLWSEGESFSGKRPFGNSGWEYEPIGALVAAGFIPGTGSDDAGWDATDDRQAHAFVATLIVAAFGGGITSATKEG